MRKAARGPNLPRWLIIVVLLNIISIIGFLVLLPDSPSGTSLVDSTLHTNPIYICWSGKTKEFSALNYASLESAILFHPTRSVVLLSGAPQHVLKHLPLNISIIHTPSLLNHSLEACLGTVLPKLHETGGSLFPLDLLWTKSSDNLPSLLLPIDTNTTMCRPPDARLCVSDDSPLLLLNIIPNDERVLQLHQAIMENDTRWRCSSVFSDNSKLAIVHHLAANWDMSKKTFGVLRSSSYAIYPTSRFAAAQFIQATTDLSEKQLVIPKWIALDDATPHPVIHFSRFTLWLYSQSRYLVICCSSCSSNRKRLSLRSDFDTRSRVDSFIRHERRAQMAGALRNHARDQCSPYAGLYPPAIRC